MGIIISLPVGIVRTLVGVVQKYILKQNKPLRIDLPLPFIPIDVVFMSDPAQILSTANHPHVDRLHAVPTMSLPTWAQWYFSATRFHNKKNDKWFLAFEPESETRQYSERKAVFVDKLAEGFTEEDVKSTADALIRGEPEESIAVVVAKMLNRRFFKDGSSSITPVLVDSARQVLASNFVQALVPGKQKKAVQATEACYDYCIKNAQPELVVMDVTHNTCTAATNLASAVMLLSKNLDTPVDFLFTRKANCPTSNIPRVVVKSTTLNGLLSYPGRPSTTILVMSNSAAADATDSLNFTFGSGSPHRPCPFHEFFVNFMTDLQTELKTGRHQEV